MKFDDLQHRARAAWPDHAQPAPPGFAARIVRAWLAAPAKDDPLAAWLRGMAWGAAFAFLAAALATFALQTKEEPLAQLCGLTATP